MQSSVDALPYIDQPAQEYQTASAKALVTAELPQDYQTTIHPSIPALREPRFSDLIEGEHARLATGVPKQSGIDLTRYQLPDAPSKGDPEAWTTALQKAYASAEYLRGREVNLGLLETYGKNAWLVGNSQLEAILRDLELEVEQIKRELEEVEQARRVGQGNVAGEMQGLEEGWKKGVGQMIETQAAAEGLRREVLERKRLGAR